MHNTEFGSPQGSQQVVPEMKSDLYRPKRFFGVQFPVPLRAAEHQERLILAGEASSRTVMLGHSNYFHFVFRQANEDSSVFLVQTERIDQSVFWFQ